MESVRCTPDVIRTTTFRERLRGYDTEAVDALLDRAAVAMEDMTSRVTEMTLQAWRTRAALVSLQAEHTRVEAEHARVQAEHARVQAEHARLQAEHARAEAENARAEAELRTTKAQLQFERARHPEPAETPSPGPPVTDTPSPGPLDAATPSPGPPVTDTPSPGPHLDAATAQDQAPATSVGTRTAGTGWTWPLSARNQALRARDKSRRSEDSSSSADQPASTARRSPTITHAPLEARARRSASAPARIRPSGPRPASDPASQPTCPSASDPGPDPSLDPASGRIGNQRVPSASTSVAGPAQPVARTDAPAGVDPSLGQNDVPLTGPATDEPDEPDEPDEVVEVVAEAPRLLLFTFRQERRDWIDVPGTGERAGAGRHRRRA